MTMRVEADEHGTFTRPVSLLDKQYLAKKKIGAEYICTFSSGRDNLHNRKMWSLIAFFLDNVPEQHAALQGRTSEWLYTWLKLRVGYTDLYQIDGKEIQVPRATNFQENDNEVEYLDNFHNPAIKILAELMGYNSVFEFEDASRGWLAIQ